MASMIPSLSPTQPSSASVASAASTTTATTTTATTATSSSPTQAASTASPPLTSTASSVSSPQAHHVVPGGGLATQLPPLHHAHAPLPHHPGIMAGPSRGPPSAARSAPPNLARGGPPPAPAAAHTLQASLPSPAAERQVAEAREAVVASIGNMLDGELQSRAALLHANNAAIERQVRDVEKAVTALRREDDKLQKVADAAARRVKELGNVQNWAELLEKDFQQLEETMRLVREGSSSLSYSGSDDSGSGSEAGDAEEGPGEGRADGEQDLGEVSGQGLPRDENRDGDGDVDMDGGAAATQGAAPEVLGKGKAPEVVPSTGMDVDAPQPGPSDAQVPETTTTTEVSASAAPQTATN